MIRPVQLLPDITANGTMVLHKWEGCAIAIHGAGVVYTAGGTRWNTRVTATAIRVDTGDTSEFGPAKMPPKAVRQP